MEPGLLCELAEGRGSGGFVRPARAVHREPLAPVRLGRPADEEGLEASLWVEAKDPDADAVDHAPPASRSPSPRRRAKRSISQRRKRS